MERNREIKQDQLLKETSLKDLKCPQISKTDLQSKETDLNMTKNSLMNLKIISPEEVKLLPKKTKMKKTKISCSIKLPF